MAERQSKRDIIVQTITELSIGPVIGALFVFLLIAMAVMAVGRSKDNPLEIVLLAAGVATQAFFGYVVWKLSREQLEFSKTTTERQHRLERYPFKRDALDAFRELENIAYSRCALDQSDLPNIWRVCDSISYLFMDDVGFAALEFAESADAVCETEVQLANSRYDQSEVEQQNKLQLLFDHKKKMADLYLDALFRMQDEMHLGN